MMRRVVRVSMMSMAAMGLALASAPADEDEVAKLEKEGFVKLFDGKTLSGWQSADNPESWTALPDGTIQGKGVRSHLFSPKEYTDLEFRAEVKLNKGGNSGMYFRTAFGPEWPKGYEAQVNNSGGDPVRTGSLYNRVKVLEQLVPDDTWWTQHIICKGNHIVIKVNGKTVVDYVDKENAFQKGHLAFQQHDPGSVVHYRNVMVKDLSK